MQILIQHQVEAKADPRRSAMLRKIMPELSGRKAEDLESAIEKLDEEEFASYWDKMGSRIKQKLRDEKMQKMRKGKAKRMETTASTHKTVKCRLVRNGSVFECVLSSKVNDQGQYVIKAKKDSEPVTEEQYTSWQDALAQFKGMKDLMKRKGYKEPLPVTARQMTSKPSIVDKEFKAKTFNPGVDMQPRRATGTWRNMDVKVITLPKKDSRGDFYVKVLMDQKLDKLRTRVVNDWREAVSAFHTLVKYFKEKGVEMKVEVLPVKNPVMAAIVEAATMNEMAERVTLLSKEGKQAVSVTTFTSGKMVDGKIIYGVRVKGLPKALSDAATGRVGGDLNAKSVRRAHDVVINNIKALGYDVIEDDGKQVKAEFLVTADPIREKIVKIMDTIKRLKFRINELSANMKSVAAEKRSAIAKRISEMRENITEYMRKISELRSGGFRGEYNKGLKGKTTASLSEINAMLATATADLTYMRRIAKGV